MNEQVFYRDRLTTEYTRTDHENGVDTSIEEGVVDTEAVDSNMEDVERSGSVLTDAQDLDIQDRFWALPVQNRGVSDTDHRNMYETVVSE